MINKKTFIPMDRILKLAIDICRGLEAFQYVLMSESVVISEFF